VHVEPSADGCHLVALHGLSVAADKLLDVVVVSANSGMVHMSSKTHALPQPSKNASQQLLKDLCR
jgi:hypothetical protein